MWAKFTWNKKLYEHGNRMKAYYILGAYVKKHKEHEIDDIYRWCYEKLTWSPEKMMRSVMQKMCRCAEMNTGKAFMYWKIE